MSLGFITMHEPGAADQVLADLARDLAAEGVPVVGMLTHDPRRRACDMSLALYPDGPVVEITQDLGADAGACALDPGALELAVAWVAEALHNARPDSVLILNKFGKQEATGRGCRPLIAQGLEQGLRVVVSVPPETRSEFAEFAGDLAQELATDVAALRAFLVPDATAGA